MTYIRFQGLHDDTNIISLIDGDGGKHGISRSQFSTWRLVNPTASEQDLENLLGVAILLPGGTQIRIHVYEMEKSELGGYPHLAVLTARSGIKIENDWWVLPTPPEPKVQP